MATENRSQSSESTYQRITSRIREKRLLQVLLIVLPPSLTLLFFFVLPMGMMGYLSVLTDLPPAQFTLENYVRMFESDVYLQVIYRTSIITLQTTAIVGIIGYGLAYSIVRFSKWTTFFLLLIIIPFWTNYIIRMYAWINILQRGGVIDSVLVWANVISEPSGYLFSHEAVLVGLTYVWLPIATLPFYASLNNLDEDLIDAAKDLGAGPIKAFLTVTLPLTKSGIIGGLVLVAIPTFGSFITPMLLGGNDVVMVGMVIDDQFNAAFNWPFGAALSIVVSAVIVGLLLLSTRAGTNLLGGDA